MNHPARQSQLRGHAPLQPGSGGEGVLHGGAVVTYIKIDDDLTRLRALAAEHGLELVWFLPDMYEHNGFDMSPEAVRANLGLHFCEKKEPEVQPDGSLLCGKILTGDHIVWTEQQVEDWITRYSQGLSNIVPVVR
jgi:hypothetical protein